MKTYHKNYICTGSITDKADGSAKLVVKDLCGRTIKNSVHKSRKAALAAWYRFNA